MVKLDMSTNEIKAYRQSQETAKRIKDATANSAQFKTQMDTTKTEVSRIL